MGEGAGRGAPSGREVGSTWLVVSGPPGSKVVETFDDREGDAREYAAGMTARGVEAEVREMVALAFPVTLRVDVERAGRGDGALISTLLAKALLRGVDSALNSALSDRAESSAPEEREALRIVVPTLVPSGARTRR